MHTQEVPCTARWRGWGEGQGVCGCCVRLCTHTQITWKSTCNDVPQTKGLSPSSKGSSIPDEGICIHWLILNVQHTQQPTPLTCDAVSAQTCLQPTLRRGSSTLHSDLTSSLADEYVTSLQDTPHWVRAYHTHAQVLPIQQSPVNTTRPPH